MKIKGDTIKEGKGLLKGRLYRTAASRTVCFEEKANIKKLPVLVGTAANLKLLNQEARLKVMTAFLNGCMEAGTKKYKLECRSPVEQDDKFVCDLEVTCP